MLAPVHVPPSCELPPDYLPARMLNEFVYCPRLFYYEHVEGVFVESADTVRGAHLHRRADSGSGAMPPADDSQREMDEVIHSRSVSLSSDSLRVTAKLDLVEVIPSDGDLLAPRQTCPVDYKAGAPRRAGDDNDIWDTDRMQLGLQCLLLRDNGYRCQEGIIYYRATKQRVRLPFTPELEAWILDRIEAAREAARGPIPPPLGDSPKCPRCSLAGVCLPDETALLSRQASQDAAGPGDTGEPARSTGTRRLIAPRDDRRALYLNTQGARVGCSGEVLKARDGERVIDEVRISDIDHVGLFGNVQITTQALHRLCDADVPVGYFSMGGWFYGITRGHALPNVFTRIQQFRAADRPEICLAAARAFVEGKIRNQRTMLMRNHVEPPAQAVAQLKRSALSAREAVSVEELLGKEGFAASLYFEHFGGMLKRSDEDLPGLPTADPVEWARGFDFRARNRRPPRDPVNALLSLAYSLLAKDCTLAACAVGFDPYIGFCHRPRFGRAALALDVMEEFRPLIADSAVLTAINNRMISETDFVRAGQSVNLSAKGRKAFFQAYERRINQLVTHPLFDYKVTYRRAIELQFRILARWLTGEIGEYTPFVTR